MYAMTLAIALRAQVIVRARPAFVAITLEKTSFATCITHNFRAALLEVKANDICQAARPHTRPIRMLCMQLLAALVMAMSA
jgi:hypothetical protein